MTKDEELAMDLALEALENSIDLVSNEAREAEKMYANVPTRLARVQGLVALEVAHEAAITAIKQARSAPVREPVWIQPDHLQKAQRAPFLCRVEPHKRDDFVPLYTTPPAQPAPVREPVAIDADMRNVLHGALVRSGKVISPPAAQRQWVGLTPEKIDELMYRFTGYELLYAIQAELKENNT